MLLPELRHAKLFKLHLARNLVQFMAQYLWTIGVVMLPHACVFALEFTMPIWVALLAFLFLREKTTRLRIFATISSFIPRNQ